MQLDEVTKLLLEQRSAEMRRLIVEGVYAAASGHPGGSLSAADIISYLYFYKMNVSPENANNPDRDRFVLSKGHACPALYAALAIKGFFPKEDIQSLRHLGAHLQGHPDMNKTPGVDMSTGSLGQGFSAANGIAKIGKIKNKNYRVYTILGDGESEEGQVWEAAMFASHYKLDNLTAFLDLNYLQIDGDIRNVMNPTPLDEKFASFGWYVQVIDGHNFDEINTAVENAEKTVGKPSMIICKTIKGKGVSYMENNGDWHGKAPDVALYEVAKNETEKEVELATESYNKVRGNR